MPALKRAWRRLLFRLRRDQLDAELREELQLHRELKEKSGESADEVRREMGNVTLERERSRDAWSFRFVEDFLHDFGHALRMMRKNPGFSLAAVLSLALGIGGNTAIFSFVNALLIRPLPYPEPDRLVRITSSFPMAGYEILQQSCRSMEIASVSPGAEYNLTGNGPATRLTGSDVSANFFTVLGVGAERGRTFQVGENRPGADTSIILSHSLWQERFGADPGIVGRPVILAGVSRTVVGVMPPSFAFPSRRVQFWIPSRINPGQQEEYWSGEFVPLIARMRSANGIALAQREVHGVVEGLWKRFPWPMPRNWNSDSKVVSLQTDLVGDVRGRLLILLAAVGSVLLIACSNIACLLLSRAISRRKEMALRAAIGAGRSRIVRQLLAEGIALGVTGSLVGLLVGGAAPALLMSILPGDLPGSDAIRLDFTVIVFTLGLGLATGIVFGLAPALSAGRADLADTLKSGTQRNAGVAWSRLRSCLVAAEVAFAVVLVLGAGLLMKSLYGLSTVKTGFNVDRILTVKISPDQSLCADPQRCIASYRRLVEEAHGIAGATEVALANTLPMDGTLPLIAADVENHPRTADHPSPMLWAGAVSAGYLKLMGIPLLEGRSLNDADGPKAPGVLLVSAATAKRFWPNESAIGKHIKAVFDQQWRTIVGVVADVRQFNLDNNPSTSWINGAMYMPYAQSVQADRHMPAVMNLLVKTAVHTPQIANEIRQVAMQADPNVPVGPVLPLENIVADSIAG